MAGDKTFAVADSKSQVGQATLVPAAGGVADDDRKDIDAEMIVIRPPDGTLQQITSVAAPQIDDEWSNSTEELFQVERSVGQSLQRCAGPMGGVKDLSRDGHAEFALNP